MKTRGYIFYLDYLRVISTIAVVILHVAAQNFYSVDVNSYAWNIFNVYDSAVRWAVPVFVMISGALFLDNTRVIDTKKLYIKNILRMIIAFVVWSFIYAIFCGSREIHSIVNNFITGHYHMWFLFMIVGLYMIVPILRKITESLDVTKYFLFLSFLFTFLFPMLLKISIIPKIEYLNQAYHNTNFYLTLGYSSYFVLGYYLSQVQFSKFWKKVIYILGIFGFFFTAVLTIVFSLQNGQPFTDFYDYFSITVLFESVAMFVFVRYNYVKFKFFGGFRRLTFWLSKCSFGVYLVHVLVLEKLFSVEIHTLVFNSVYSVPIISIIVFFMSMVISYILNHIPILKNYIV